MRTDVHTKACVHVFITMDGHAMVQPTPGISLGSEKQKTQNSLSESPENYVEWKQPARKGCVLSWKQQNHRTGGRICGC